MKFIVLILALICIHPAWSSAIIQKQLTVTVTDSSQKVLDANLRRGFLIVQNNGEGNVHLKFDSVHAGTEGMVIVGGGNWEPTNIPLNAIYLKSDAAESNSITILEGE